MTHKKSLGEQLLSRRRFTASLALTGMTAIAGNPLAKADDRAPSQSNSSQPTSRRTHVKKGVCGKGGKCDLTGVGWYYNWTRNSAPGKINAEFVPMIKGKGNANNNTFAKIEQLKKTHGVTHLLGFNDPDSKSQDNYRFMREVLPRLQQLAYVERYAWYSGHATDISCIYDPSKPTGLNPLGEYYRTI